MYCKKIINIHKYENEVGVFTSIDPLWEEYRCWTPYQYAGNNPIMALDWNGKNGVKIVDEENCTITLKANYHVNANRGDYKPDEMFFTREETNNIQANINFMLANGNYQVSSGEFQGYNVNFDLQLFYDEGLDFNGNLINDISFFNGINIYNTFNKADRNITISGKYPLKGSFGNHHAGVTVDYRDVFINYGYYKPNSGYNLYRTIIHEFLHNLFFDLDNNSTGIGSYVRRDMINQTDINVLINNLYLPTVR